MVLFKAIPIELCGRLLASVLKRKVGGVRMRDTCALMADYVNVWAKTTTIL